MAFDPVYTLLRNLTSPVVAITTSAGGVRNGLIVNSAQRASLVPTIPRISIYISKINYSHDLIYRGGVFTLHLLRNDQWDVIWKLGFESGREGDKLAAFELIEGKTGCPMLADCVAAFECQVVNGMDTGASTFFLGEVVNVHTGREGPLTMRICIFGLSITSCWGNGHATVYRSLVRALSALGQKIL